MTSIIGLLQLSMMAVRLQSLLQQPDRPVELEQARDAIAALPGFKDWIEVSAFRDHVVRYELNITAFERLQHRIKQQFQVTIDPETLSCLLLGFVDQVHKKIRKSGPFEIVALKPEYPWFAHLINNALQQLKELPDFSDDGRIFVMSDFGGEHSSALFNTYSFLILAQNKIGPFQTEVEALRQKHGLSDGREFAYKRLKSDGRSRALPEFLKIVDTCIHGAVITVAIDRKIGTVFGMSKHEAHRSMVDQLETKGFGDWKGLDAEKVCRVCHALAIFVSLLTKPNQRLLWYCDNDAINADGVKRTFAHTQDLFVKTLAMYATHTLELVGFAKSFSDKTYLDDLLSVADLAAGVVQDLLQGHATGENIPGGEEKVALIKWIAAPATFLSKINVQIVQLEDGQVGSGLISFTPKKDENVYGT
jgi:hypothetical protein